MTRLLFDTPWWFPTFLAGIGAFLFWTGNNRREARVRNAGLAMIAAAVGVVLLSYFVDTALETAVKRSKGLVYAVEKRDWATMKATLDPTVSLSVMGAQQLYVNRDELIHAAQRAVEQYGIKNLRVLSTTPEQNDSLITITMTVMSEQDFTQGYPITTNWQLEWQQTGKEWSLIRITCIKIGNLTGENAVRQFPAPK